MLIEFYDGETIDDGCFITLEMDDRPRVGEFFEFDIREIRYKFEIKSVNIRYNTKLIDSSTTFELSEIFCFMKELNQTPLQI